MIDLGAIINRFRRKPDLTAEFRAFNAVFRSQYAKDTVLPILIQKSGLCVPAPDTDSLFAQGRAAGRRDMMLLIQHYTQLTEEDIYTMLKSNPLKPEELQRGR